MILILEGEQLYLPKKLSLLVNDRVADIIYKLKRDNGLSATRGLSFIEAESLDTVQIVDNHVYVCETISMDIIHKCLAMSNTYLIIYCDSKFMSFILEDGVLDNLCLMYVGERKSIRYYASNDFNFRDSMSITSKLVDDVIEEGKSIDIVDKALSKLIKGNSSLDDILIRTSVIDYLVNHGSFLSVLRKNRMDLFDDYLRFLFSLEKVGVSCTHFIYTMYDKLCIKDRILSGESFESMRDDLIMTLQYNLYGWNFDDYYPAVKITDKYLILRISNKFVVMKARIGSKINVLYDKLCTGRDIYRMRIVIDNVPFPGILLLDKTKDDVITTIPDSSFKVLDSTTQLNKYLVLGE